MAVVLSIMPMLIFEKRKFIIAILSVVFLSLKVFTTLSVTKRSGENTLQAGC